MKEKVGVISLGCPKNLVDSEVMLGILKNENFEIINDIKEADIIIINTCGFIESAKQESINAILEATYEKKEKCRKLIVAGCLAERYKEQILEQMPEVDAVVGVANYAEILSVLEQIDKGDKVQVYGEIQVDYLKNNRLLTTSGYAYLKIAEGCDNCCTYCAIPSIRGRFISRKIEDLIEEANNLVSSGVKELIFVAQDTTKYGIDLYGKHSLVKLIREIAKIKDLKWIRLLYCYPESIDDELIDEIALNEKVVKYLDIPFQHASDDVLSRMARKGTNKQYYKLIDKLKSKIANLTIRTTFIVGFPGETEEDFEILYNFVKKVKFDRLGVFTYSKEEGTPASKFKGQLSKKIKIDRLEKIMSVQQKITFKANNARKNDIYEVIVEGVADDGMFYKGRSSFESPDIDPVIYFTSEQPLTFNSFVKVKIVNQDNYDLIGVVIDESSK